MFRLYNAHVMAISYATIYCVRVSMFFLVVALHESTLSSYEELVSHSPNVINPYDEDATHDR